MLKSGDFARCACTDERGGMCSAQGVIVEALDPTEYELAWFQDGVWYQDIIYEPVSWTPDNPDELWASYCAWRLTNA